jgi:hypothetical protein
LKLPAIASGLFISTPTATLLSAGGATGINLASGTTAHFMNACPIYYTHVKLKPERLIPYITEIRAKKVVYTDFLTNTFNNISAGSTSSFFGLIRRNKYLWCFTHPYSIWFYQWNGQ